MQDLLQATRTLSCWTSDDTRNAICATLASAGIGFLVVTNDRDYGIILKVSTIRNFLPREITLYQVMDLLAYGSAGYASYLVYKYGGGFLDGSGTTLALLLFGCVSIFDFIYGPRAVDSPRLAESQLFHNYAYKTLATLALSNTYLAIYEEACGWMLPFAISSLLKMIACYPFA